MRTFLSRLIAAFASGLVVAVVFEVIFLLLNSLEMGWAVASAGWRHDSGFRIRWLIGSGVFWALVSLAGAYWRAWRGPRWWD